MEDRRKRKKEEKRGRRIPHRSEAKPVKETLTSLKGMVPKPKKKLLLEEMDQAIGKVDRG